MKAGTFHCQPHAVFAEPVAELDPPIIRYGTGTTHEMVTLHAFIILTTLYIRRHTRGMVTVVTSERALFIRKQSGSLCKWDVVLVGLVAR